MRVAVSNIAWDPVDDVEVARILADAGIDAVEVAPTRAWPDVQRATLRDAAEYRAHWASMGMSVISTQALLFGRPDLKLFGTPDERAAFVAYVKHVLTLGAALGAQAQVFGSPRNRRRGGLAATDAVSLAAEVFGELAEHAAVHETTLVLEANPVEYGADFLVSAHEAAALVADVSSPGLQLHLDTACMQLAGDDVEECVRRYSSSLAHVHLSEKDLGPVGLERSPQHEQMISALCGVGYNGGVTVEMAPGPSAVEAVAVAAGYVAALVAPTTG